MLLQMFRLPIKAVKITSTS